MKIDGQDLKDVSHGIFCICVESFAFFGTSLLLLALPPERCENVTNQRRSIFQHSWIDVDVDVDVDVWGCPRSG